MKITATHDSHHVYQDAAFTNLGNYKRNQAVAIGPQGRISPTDKRTTGTPHYYANTVQRKAKGGGTIRSETVIAYKALRDAGLKADAAVCAIYKARAYLNKFGVTSKTATLIPKNRTI